MSDEIKIKKDTLWKACTVILAVALIVVLVVGVGGNGNGNAVAENNNPPSGNEPTTGSVKVQIEDGDPILGDENAEISIVEFSDFECPFCQRAYTGAVADFKQSSYFENGEVNLVYKHFPLNSIHPNAQKAGEAAECANRQGNFWDYHDKLFENQQALGVSSLKQYAADVGLDTAEFNDCLDNGEAESEVNKETTQATTAGARGTPFFVVINTETGDTQTVSGAVPFSQFESAISAVK